MTDDMANVTRPKPKGLCSYNCILSRVDRIMCSQKEVMFRRDHKLFSLPAA